MIMVSVLISVKVHFASHRVVDQRAWTVAVSEVGSLLHCEVALCLGR